MDRLKLIKVTLMDSRQITMILHNVCAIIKMSRNVLCLPWNDGLWLLCFQTSCCERNRTADEPWWKYEVPNMKAMVNLSSKAVRLPRAVLHSLSNARAISARCGFLRYFIQTSNVHNYSALPGSVR